MRQKNIFYNLIKNETSLTEVFCNLLSYKPFRDMFLNIVHKKNPQVIPSKIRFTNFDTEIVLRDDKKNKGRSDLYLNANNTEYIFEIKINKFTAPTENQPIGYLQYLENNKESDPNKRLFFIIPRGYQHLNEICKNWTEKNNEYSQDQITDLNVIFWEDILEKIKNSELDKLNPIINEFRRILKSQWLEYIRVVFTKFEIDLIFNINKRKENIEMFFDTNIPKIIQKLFKVVDGVYEKFENKIDKSYNRQYSDAYGHVLLNSKNNIPENMSIWFGVDFEIWEKLNLPLTIQIEPEKSDGLKDILDLKLSKKFEYDDSTITTYIGIEKDIFENPEINLVEEFVKRIEMTIAKVQK